MSPTSEGRPGPARAVLNPSQPDSLLRYEFDRGSNYEEDTRLTVALSALVPDSELHNGDHRYFQIAHLMTEFAWVAVHQSLVGATEALRERHWMTSVRALHRASGSADLTVQIVQQLSETLAQLSLLEMRAQFPPNTTGLDSPGARNLRRASRALWREFIDAAASIGVDLGLLSKGLRGVGGSDVVLLAEVAAAMQRFDAKVQQWKRVHLLMVWTLVGGHPGVDSDGQARPSSLRGRDITDLERMATTTLFPVLWKHSTDTFRKEVDGV